MPNAAPSPPPPPPDTPAPLPPGNDLHTRNFTSINNNLGMYWKGSKPFRNITASLIKNSTFQYGTWPANIPPPGSCRNLSAYFSQVGFGITKGLGCFTKPKP